jgi:hypothetical protein
VYDPALRHALPMPGLSIPPLLSYATLRLSLLFFRIARNVFSSFWFAFPTVFVMSYHYIFPATCFLACQVCFVLLIYF